MTAQILSFEKAHEARHSTKDILDPAYSGTLEENYLIVEAEVDKIMAVVEKLLEERGQ